MVKQVKVAKSGASKPKGKHGGAGRGQGREPGYTHPERVRERIAVGVLLDRANKVASGEIQVKDPAVESVRQRYSSMLLAKALPDLVRTENTGKDGGPIEIITRAE